jgi:hypothetical protein
VCTKELKNNNSRAVQTSKEVTLEQESGEITSVRKQNAAVIFDLLCSFKGTIKRQKVSFQKRDWPE